MKTQRNAPCPCGSGKKYKHCCLGIDLDGSGTPHAKPDHSKAITVIAVIGLAASAGATYVEDLGLGLTVAAASVILGWGFITFSNPKKSGVRQSRRFGLWSKKISSSSISKAWSNFGDSEIDCQTGNCDPTLGCIKSSCDHLFEWK